MAHFGKLQLGLLTWLAGVALNLVGYALSRAFDLPLTLDGVGTVLLALSGGYLPGVTSAFVTSLLEIVKEPLALYYGADNIVLAICCALAAGLGKFKLPLLLLAAALATLTGMGLRSLFADYVSESTSLGFDSLTAQLYGQSITHEALNGSSWWLILLEQASEIALVLVIFTLVPRLPRFMSSVLRSALFMADQSLVGASGNVSRVISLRTKVMLLLSIALCAIALCGTAISYMIYVKDTIDQHIKVGAGVAQMAARLIDTDRVDEYMEKGREAEGYSKIERLLYQLRQSNPSVEYISVSKIAEDGSHVVFDLDTSDVSGGQPGEVRPIDERMKPYLPALLAGQNVAPVVTDEGYGWIMSIYMPVYNDDLDCVCYAIADVSLERLHSDGISYLIRLSILYVSVFAVIFVIGLWIAENNVIFPINAMAYAASRFNATTQSDMLQGLERIKTIGINTGDEIENLYRAFAQMATENVGNVIAIQTKNATIAKMQNALIMVLADMVENRDENTGEHVRKTAAYVRIIIEQMQQDGIYKEQLTPKFVSDTVNFAPLHDVGKISVSDVILNKPGKLTDEEFAIMKGHSLAGRAIIDRVIATVPDSDYLNEARNITAYHHEKWNGSGYPEGLSGTDIPLSARIMAVADVFDALVSRRSYKKGFPFEKAMDIIREGAGSHFDPKVVEAFLKAEQKVREVAEQFTPAEDSAQS